MNHVLFPWQHRVKGKYDMVMMPVVLNSRIQLWDRTGTCFTLECVPGTWDSKVKGERWRPDFIWTIVIVTTRDHTTSPSSKWGHTFKLASKHQNWSDNRNVSQNPRPGLYLTLFQMFSAVHFHPFSLFFSERTCERSRQGDAKILSCSSSLLTGQPFWMSGTVKHWGHLTSKAGQLNLNLMCRCHLWQE